MGTYNILSFWIPSSAALAEALEDILTMLRKVFVENSLERVEMGEGGVGSKGGKIYVGVERKGECEDLYTHQRAHQVIARFLAGTGR